MPTVMATSMPKKTPVPIPWRLAEPGPEAKTSGSRPRMKASEVIRIGRRRRRAALLAASTVMLHRHHLLDVASGFALALEKYGSGKVSWADVCEPARRLAATISA